MSLELGIAVIEKLIAHHEKAESKRAMQLVIANQMEQVEYLKTVCAGISNLEGALASLQKAVASLLATDMATAIELMRRSTLSGRDPTLSTADLKEARFLFLRALSSGSGSSIDKAILHRFVAIASLGMADPIGASHDLAQAERYLNEELSPLLTGIEVLRRSSLQRLRAETARIEQCIRERGESDPVLESFIGAAVTLNDDASWAQLDAIEETLGRKTMFFGTKRMIRVYWWSETHSRKPFELAIGALEPLLTSIRQLIEVIQRTPG